MCVNISVSVSRTTEQPRCWIEKLERRQQSIHHVFSRQTQSFIAQNVPCETCSQQVLLESSTWRKRQWITICSNLYIYKKAISRDSSVAYKFDDICRRNIESKFQLDKYPRGIASRDGKKCIGERVGTLNWRKFNISRNPLTISNVSTISRSALASRDVWIFGFL